ncbi:MAG: DHHA1 domain-containing protein [Thaumarchaeota archaeon]|nr:DHHA1 domain-containing protein [Nitrososphaerota archaeon]
MKSLCLSHVKDIDGISSAALVRASTRSEFMLVDYDSLFDALENLPEGLEDLYVCDLGTDQSRFAAFVDILGRLSRTIRITYIDHHYLAPEDRAALKRLPIELVHNVGDCAGMLTYLHFKDSLPPEAAMVALYAAVTDYMDDSKKAKAIMQTYDRHMIMLESSLLSYALAKNGKDPEYPRMLVAKLAEMRLPHQIPGVVEEAIAQADVVARLIGRVKHEGKMLENVAYCETKQTSTGLVAKLLLGAFGAPVGVAFKRKAPERVEMSLRCTSKCEVHLGKTIGAIAAKHGGSGGGHARAAGCTVPASEMLKVIRELDQAVAA